MRPRFLAAALALALAGCGPITFVTELKGEGVVPGSMLGGALTAFPVLGNLAAIDFDENQDFKANGATRARVSSLKVESFTVKVLEPGDQDFTFLDQLQVYGKSGDEEILIAEKNGIAALNLPPPNPTLTLEVTNKELVTLLAAPQVSMVLRGKGRQPALDTRLEARAKVRVGLKL